MLVAAGDMQHGSFQLGKPVQPITSRRVWAFSLAVWVPLLRAK